MTTSPMTWTKTARTTALISVMLCITWGRSRGIQRKTRGGRREMLEEGDRVAGSDYYKKDFGLLLSGSVLPHGLKILAELSHAVDQTSLY